MIDCPSSFRLVSPLIHLFLLNLRWTATTIGGKYSSTNLSSRLDHIQIHSAIVRILSFLRTKYQQIARVFLRKPKIILLDEATSALDENSQDAVQTALSNLIKESNATVVMVAHRLSTVVNADKICVIDKGQVLEQGSHEELANRDGGIYASMVEKQLAKKGDMLDQDQEGSKKGSKDSIDALLAD